MGLEELRKKVNSLRAEIDVLNSKIDMCDHTIRTAQKEKMEAMTESHRKEREWMQVLFEIEEEECLLHGEDVSCRYCEEQTRVEKEYEEFVNTYENGHEENDEDY